MDLEEFQKLVIPNKPKQGLSVDPIDNFVEVDTTPLNYVTSSTAFMCSGPPTLNLARKNISTIFPIGLVTGLTCNQSRQYSNWTEMNARYGRGIPGRVSSQMQVIKVFTDQTSILYALLKWFMEPLREEGSDIDSLLSEELMGESPGYLENGVENQFGNLGSELFVMPTGLLLFYYNAAYNIVDAGYAQNVKIISKGRQINTTDGRIFDNVQLLPTNIIPATKLGIQSLEKLDYSFPVDPQAVLNQ